MGSRKAHIPSYRFLLPSEVILGLITTAKTSGKPLQGQGVGGVSKTHSLEGPSSEVSHLEPQTTTGQVGKGEQAWVSFWPGGAL